MPKRKRTFKTFWGATTATRRSSALAVAAAIAAAIAYAPPLHAQSTPSLSAILAGRRAAIESLHVRETKTLDVEGSIGGGDLIGSFHRWQSGSRAREDDVIGPHEIRTYRLNDAEFIVNETGNVRKLGGLLARRQITQDFVASDAYVDQPQYDSLGALTQLPGGRSAYPIVVTPPGGQAETVYVDRSSFLVDRLSYNDDDGVSTVDYFDYTVIGGALVARREVDSNGDHAYDVVHDVRHVIVDRAIDPATFSVPPSTVVLTDAPVTVPLHEVHGHLFTDVTVGSKKYRFLIDTGAQMVAIDTHVAAEQEIPYAGHLEVAGAQRTGGLGFARLSEIEIAGARLPLHSVSVLDLRGPADADGVLGYPFFASAEVSIDPIARTMTFARPGTLHPQGDEIPVDTDRELVEIPASVNNTAGTFVVDTGNSTELLLYGPFMQEHPDVVPLQDRQSAASDYGVGGTTRASLGYVDQLAFGSFRLFNRYANIIMNDTGAFADRFDAGNIGMGVLKNFVMTFDEANRKMYAAKTPVFDDGRNRRRYEDPGVIFP